MVLGNYGMSTKYLNTEYLNSLFQNPVDSGVVDQMPLVADDGEAAHHAELPVFM